MSLQLYNYTIILKINNITMNFIKTSEFLLNLINNSHIEHDEKIFLTEIVRDFLFNNDGSRKMCTENKRRLINTIGQYNFLLSGIVAIDYYFSYGEAMKT